MSERRTLRLPGYDYSADGAYFVTMNTKNRIHFFGEVRSRRMRLGPIGEIAEMCWKEIPEHHAGVSLNRFQIMPDHVHGILFLDSLYPSGSGSLQVPSKDRQDPSGRNFQDPSGRNFQDLSGRNFQDLSGRNFQDLSGRNFQDLSGRNFQDLSGRVQLNAPTEAKLVAPTEERLAATPPKAGTPSYFSHISPHRRALGVIVRTYKAAVTTWCRRSGFPGFQWQSGYYDRIIRNNEEFENIRYYIQQNPKNYYR